MITIILPKESWLIIKVYFSSIIFNRFLFDLNVRITECEDITSQPPKNSYLFYKTVEEIHEKYYKQ